MELARGGDLRQGALKGEGGRWGAGGGNGFPFPACMGLRYFRQSAPFPSKRKQKKKETSMIASARSAHKTEIHY